MRAPTQPFRALTRGLAGPALLAVGLAVAGRILLSTAPAVPHDAPARAGVAPAPEAFVLRESVANWIVTPVSATASVPRRVAPPRASRSALRRSRVAAKPARWTRPAYGPLTSPYGFRWGRLHQGIDIGARWGAPIYAAADGVVTYVGPKAGYGTLVLIRHAGGVVTAYGHMSRYATRTGARVRAGEVIAYVGAAGDATGPHLHFEVRPDGTTPVNPLPWLRRHGIRI